MHRKTPHMHAQSQGRLTFVCTRQVCTLQSYLPAYICIHALTHIHIPICLLAHAYAHLYMCVHTPVNPKGTDVPRLVMKSETLAERDSQVSMHLQGISTRHLWPSADKCGEHKPLLLQHTHPGLRWMLWSTLHATGSAWP